MSSDESTSEGRPHDHPINAYFRDLGQLDTLTDVTMLGVPVDKADAQWPLYKVKDYFEGVLPDFGAGPVICTCLPRGRTRIPSIAAMVVEDADPDIVRRLFEEVPNLLCRVIIGEAKGIYAIKELALGAWVTVVHGEVGLITLPDKTLPESKPSFQLLFKDMMMIIPEDAEAQVFFVEDAILQFGFLPPTARQSDGLLRWPLGPDQTMSVL